MKFKFTTSKDSLQSLYSQMKDYLMFVDRDKKMECIIREEISWDISRMRKFFEGPVCEFVAKMFVEHKRPVGKGIVREALKAKFIGMDEDMIPISTTTLDFKKWKQFLLDIDTWCIDEFHCGLPSPEDIE